MRADFAQAVGNTPLLRLTRASEATGCEILAKAEFLNPGGSVKDRAALGIIRDAEARGLIQPGGVIVEGTAGNTGIGLALLGNSLGYRTVIVMPETMSEEKVRILESYGAEVRRVPAAPYKNPENYVHISERLAASLNRSEPNGAFWANQFNNLANRDIHYRTTGPEIWRQTGGEVDGFVCASGTGGTLAGVGAYLKEQKAGIQIALSDPAGSVLYNYYTTGELSTEGESLTEGIGNSRLTKNQETAAVDAVYRIEDTESLPLIFDLLAFEGYCAGTSSGVNIAGATRLARQLGPGHTIVTLLCDSGNLYRAKIYNPAFLRDKGLPVPSWLE